MNYYNDNDAFASKWLRELIKAGLIPTGEVDDRSITEVRPSDLRGFKQCHFFAGIAGWPRALELAGWDTDEPVWSASLPCQPLSNAGQQRGHLDERNLWGVFCNLVKECRPTKIFGEQVASKLGREWLSGIQTDLETLGYISAAADLPAASVGSPHKRNRLFWVADSELARRQKTGKRHEQPTRNKPEPGCGQANFWSNSVLIPCADGKARRVPGRVVDEHHLEIERIFQPMVARLRNRMGDSWHDGILEALNCFPLAESIPGRVGLLRGAGNSILPQVASEFIRAFLDKE